MVRIARLPVPPILPQSPELPKQPIVHPQIHAGFTVGGNPRGPPLTAGAPPRARQLGTCRGTARALGGSGGAGAPLSLDRFARPCLCSCVFEQLDRRLPGRQLCKLHLLNYQTSLTELSSGGLRQSRLRGDLRPRSSALGRVSGCLVPVPATTGAAGTGLGLCLGAAPPPVALSGAAASPSR